jgi:hypothetical protein
MQPVLLLPPLTQSVVFLMREQRPWNVVCRRQGFELSTSCECFERVSLIPVSRAVCAAAPHLCAGAPALLFLMHGMHALAPCMQEAVMLWGPRLLPLIAPRVQYLAFYFGSGVEEECYDSIAAAAPQHHLAAAEASCTCICLCARAFVQGSGSHWLGRGRMHCSRRGKILLLHSSGCCHACVCMLSICLELCARVALRLLCHVTQRRTGTTQRSFAAPRAALGAILGNRPHALWCALKSASDGEEW